MADLEKVIKGLECVICPNKFCGECSYFIRNENDPDTGWCDRDAVYRDALSLLKAQEPRVMTLEEVITHYSLPPVVPDDLDWKEDYLQDIEPLYFDFPVKDSWAVHWRGYQQVSKYLEDWRASYGQKWRCWTSRPTEEQRRVTPWE